MEGAGLMIRKSEGSRAKAGAGGGTRRTVSGHSVAVLRDSSRNESRFGQYFLLASHSELRFGCNEGFVSWLFHFDGNDCGSWKPQLSLLRRP